MTRPDEHTKMTIPELIAWLHAVEDRRWIWGRNFACKYVEICIDTRAGVYAICDRDGNDISSEELVRQFHNGKWDNAA